MDLSFGMDNQNKNFKNYYYTYQVQIVKPGNPREETLPKMKRRMKGLSKRQINRGSF